jgi:hypothetical protein
MIQCCFLDKIPNINWKRKRKRNLLVITCEGHRILWEIGDLENFLLLQGCSGRQTSACLPPPGTAYNFCTTSKVNHAPYRHIHAG